MDGAFPEGFYSTTNQRTEIALGGRWVAVDDQEMDCGIVVDARPARARCVPMDDVRRGDRSSSGTPACACFPRSGRAGRRRSSSWGATSRPRSPRGWPSGEIARELADNRAGGRQDGAGGRTGRSSIPAAASSCKQLIRVGYVDVLFAGNALATHDIEQALFGTSLGVYLDRG